MSTIDHQIHSDGVGSDSPLLGDIEQILGYEFLDRDLLALALTHASRADHRLASNERLEFLGDAVLGMVVCEDLFRQYATLQEGDLTKLKSAVVSRETCADIADALGLDRFILLGKGMSNREALPRSLSAGVFEAVIGAIFLDGGYDAAKVFLLRVLKKRIVHAAESGHQQNFKSVLQQLAQQHLTDSPQYVMLDEQGPDHAKCFEICVEIGAVRFPSSWGASKKRAEQQAALNALIELGFAVIDPATGDATLVEDLLIEE
ncbi:MAG: ribonuclease III [Phycisphaerales bacterium]